MGASVTAKQSRVPSSELFVKHLESGGSVNGADALIEAGWNIGTQCHGNPVQEMLQTKRRHNQYLCCYAVVLSSSLSSNTVDAE